MACSAVFILGVQHGDLIAVDMETVATISLVNSRHLTSLQVI